MRRRSADVFASGLGTDRGSVTFARKQKEFDVPCTCFSRRQFLVTASAGSALGLSGCVEPPPLVASDQLDAMGLQAWADLKSSTPVSGNAAHKATLDAVARRLLQQAGESPAAWEAEVFASPEVNAFALPGRKIGVYEGMFGVAQNPDQLAAVVGHEIGHLEANHPQERVSAEVATDAGLRVVGSLLNAGNVQYASEIGAALGLGAQVGILLPYSRSQETEADRYGLRLMVAAGYDGRQALELWRRMEASGGARGPEFLSTHPAPEARIAAMEAYLAELT